MRTKTLILSALLGLAGSASLMAQTNVYSLNAVGYVNVTIPANSFKMIANPLNTTNNTLNNLMPYNNGAIPAGTQVYKYPYGGPSPASGTATMDEFDLVWSPNLNFAPGEGAFIKNNSGSPITLTFVGEVMQGSLSNSLPTGYAMRGSMVPQQGTLGPNSVGLPNLGVPGQPGDQVSKFVGPPVGYITSTFDEFDLVWSPNLTNDVAEGFFIRKNAGEPWLRTFSVNN